jgi:RNA polymerase sigma factor (sigma-70 family)
MTPSFTDRRERLAVLLQEARESRRGALDEIVGELGPLLWHVVRAQGLDRSTSEDVVQTTWLTLLRYLHTIHTPEALVAWLITVARREARRVRDLDRRHVPVDEDLLVTVRDPDPGPDEQVLADDRRRLLWSAVQELSPMCRELLRIVAFMHRPDYELVSAALGLPRGSIGPTRGRCLRKLRDRLSADPTWSWR